MNPPQMPTKLPPQLLAALSQKQLGDRLTQIAIAAVEQCRTDQDQFLRDYPSLDLRNPPPVKKHPTKAA